MLIQTSLRKILQYTFASVFFIISCSISVAANAGEADVVDVVITKTPNGQFRIDTTVLHDDNGWDHYADRWDVVAPDGTVLGSRVLAHPHDNEQPFTRSLTLAIPADITKVTIRANDSVHELGGKEMQVTVPH